MSTHSSPTAQRECSPLLPADPVTVVDMSEPLVVNVSNTPSPERPEEAIEAVVEESLSLETLDSLPPMRSAIFTMTPAFMGYAALVTLQDNIKKRLGIVDGNSPGSYEFSFAVSWLYLGNLIFRLMHNIIFERFSPRARVCIAYVCLSIACMTLAIAYYLCNSKSITWVFVAYMTGGIGVGTFESNLISSITPLGHKTKQWAQFGISIGFNGVSVGAFLLYAAFPASAEWLQCGTYIVIALCNLAGLAFFTLAIPQIDYSSSKQGLAMFWKDIRRFREWLPLMASYSAPFPLDMASLGFFSAVQLYIYNVAHIPLWWHSSVTVPENAFRAVFNLHSLLGDGLGRKIAYSRSRLTHPAFFLILSAIGGGLILSKIALIAPLGMFLVMFANGSMYATTTKYVDVAVPQRFNLIALSFWLFVGDVGSFVGSNLVNVARVAIGGVPTA
jgi:hypothetical protein